MVIELLARMDAIREDPKSNIIVIGATNRLNSIGPALRRYGRFGHEIEFGIPDAIGRLEMLEIHTKKMNLAKDVNLQTVYN